MRREKIKLTFWFQEEIDPKLNREELIKQLTEIARRVRERIPDVALR